MISCSHWGMFAAPVFPLLLPRGFKLAPGQEAELRRPDGIISIVSDDRTLVIYSAGLENNQD